jgi:DNA-directed RNA polymerase subunit RPC12/RpoP
MKCDSCGHELMFSFDESVLFCQGCGFRRVVE